MADPPASDRERSMSPGDLLADSQPELERLRLQTATWEPAGSGVDEQLEA